MICKYFTPVLFFTAAVTISQVFCDTRALYQIQPLPQQQQHQTEGGQVSNNYYESIPSNAVAAPRFGSLSWNVFEFVTLESLIQPVVTCIGFLVGYFGFTQIANWLLDLIATTKSMKKTPIEVKNTTVEETNEIDARRKRMLSIENTERVLGSIEAAEKKFEQ